MKKDFKKPKHYCQVCGKPKPSDELIKKLKVCQACLAWLEKRRGAKKTMDKKMGGAE